MAYPLFLGLIINLATFLNAGFPVNDSGTLQKQDDLPRAFLIGEFEKRYEEMTNDYNTLLLNNYKEDLEKAYSGWTSVLVSMEDFAKETSFDLKGLKLWVNVFFNEDGSIQHLVYYPKPNSKYMDLPQLTNFFIAFCKYYHFRDPLLSKCSHFGSASFPTFAKRN